MISLILALVLIASCSTTKPTPYQKEKKKQGYRDTTFEELKVASFKGNNYTRKDKAQLYAQFRAIESCLSDENTHANIIDIFDKTIQKEITRSSGSSWGPSYYGMYPYYSRYSSFGLSAGFNTINTNSWSETLVFPVIEIYYTCSEFVYRPQVIFKELTADEIKHLVKDVKGAIQVEKILENSPNAKSLELGDIILKANGKRIEKVFELIRMFNKEMKEVNVQLLRDGDRQVARIKSVDITPDVAKAEKDIIDKVCKSKKDKREKELKERKICE